MTYCVLSRYQRSDGRWKITLQRTPTQRRKEEYQSRLIVAIKLRRPLADGEVVHHLNGDKSDDRLANLDVFESQRAHAKAHGSYGADIRDVGRTCSSCGCDLSDRTVGCARCSNRHAQRRQANSERPYIPTSRTHCNRCGVPYDLNTPDCESCAQRHRVRRRKMRKVAS